MYWPCLQAVHLLFPMDELPLLCIQVQVQIQFQLHLQHQVHSHNSRSLTSKLESLNRKGTGKKDLGYLFLTGIAALPRGQVLMNFWKYVFKMFVTKQPVSLAFRIITCLWRCLYLEIQNNLYLQLLQSNTGVGLLLQIYAYTPGNRLWSISAEAI